MSERGRGRVSVCVSKHDQASSNTKTYEAVPALLGLISKVTSYAKTCVCECVCVEVEAQWPGGWCAGFGIWNCMFQVQALARNKKKTACIVSLDKALYSHCLSPPSCKNGYLTLVGEAKDRWVARIPSSSDCGPGRTSGAHAISHCAIQRLLVHTGPVSGGFVSAGPKILRSGQETWLL